MSETFLDLVEGRCPKFGSVKDDFWYIQCNFGEDDISHEILDLVLRRYGDIIEWVPGFIIRDLFI